MKSSERNIVNLHEMYTGTPSHYKAEGKSSILLDKPSFYTLTTKKDVQPNQYIKLLFTSIYYILFTSIY